MDPSTFLPIVGGLLGKGSGGAKSSSSAVNALNVSVNPTIANVFGPGTVTPSTYAPASGSPSTNTSASEGSGNDPYSFLPRGNSYGVPVRPGASYLTGPQGQMLGAGLFGSGNDDLLLLIIIGAGLWFAMQQ
jgi:hypothetical protein